MATRGTYQFWTKHSPVITVYLHHDNYPQGAAVYLFNEVLEAPVRSVEEFIRINPKAIITADHAIHGDTDYRYDIFFNPRCRHNIDRIMAFERNFPKADLEESWSEIANGSLKEFCQKHIRFNTGELDSHALELMCDRERLRERAQEYKS